MRTILDLPLVFFVALGLLLGAIGVASHAAQQPEPVSLVKVEVGTDVKMQLQETTRGTRTSTFRVTQNRRGSPTADTLLLVYGFARVAEARGAAYFTNLKEWSDPDGSRMYVVGFADSKTVDVPEYFGDKYSRTNESGQPRGLLSTAMNIRLLGGDKGTR